MTEIHEPLTRRQQEIVNLIDAGFTRWKIADELEITEESVRGHIRRLCERFDCPMRDLPERAGVTAE